ncbi:hypothetical protein BHE74_00045085 [Ensete ventricosum]|nr:hypothetical protein BHE74_00045085 [Ensete ventricosum]RZS11649.1 hypothetical protein BHM03_00043007 [Ensete ventricosum]
MSQERPPPGNPIERPGEEMSLTPSTLGLRGASPFPPHADENAFASTPNHSWQLFNDPRLSPHGVNLRQPGVSPEAFHNLTHQVQALAGVMQVSIPLIL